MTLSSLSAFHFISVSGKTDLSLTIDTLFQFLGSFRELFENHWSYHVIETF